MTPILAPPAELDPTCHYRHVTPSGWIVTVKPYNIRQTGDGTVADISYGTLHQGVRVDGITRATVAASELTAYTVTKEQEWAAEDLYEEFVEWSRTHVDPSGVTTYGLWMAWRGVDSNVDMTELPNTGGRLAEARDGFEDAVKAVEDIATEQAATVGAELDVVDGTIIDGRQALIDSGDLPGPDGAYLSTTQRTALAQFRTKWAAQNGVTR